EVLAAGIEERLLGSLDLSGAIAIDLADALLVGMPVEAEPDAGEIAAQVLRVLQEMARPGHVLLDVAHAAMGEEEALLEHAVRRQVAQPRGGRGRQRAARALQRVHRLVRETLEPEHSRADEVVVPGDAKRV